MTEELEILESAISDVGHWSWWTERLPAVFQVEFCGVQLWLPPREDGQPPCGQIALRFFKPSTVAFLRRGDSSGASLADDWFEKLRADEIETFGIDNEAFTLTSPERANAILRDANTQLVYHGTIRELPADAPHGSYCAFWAGPVGLYLVAESMIVCSHAGDLALDQLKPMSRKWWDYWREYWDKINTDNPLPKDYACDVTIPAGRGIGVA
jgi:hypothetical protein